MERLRVYAERLRGPGRQVPDFDPLDGGAQARILFLFEKPGPMAAADGERSGSGFISRNNDDPTADATFHFMQDAGIARELTVIWNVVPWWDGTRRVHAADLKTGVQATLDLLSLLPDLEVIVLVGRKAATAKEHLPAGKYRVIESTHPSPIVRARWPEVWGAIPNEWRRVHAALGTGNLTH